MILCGLRQGALPRALFIVMVSHNGAVLLVIASSHGDFRAKEFCYNGIQPNLENKGQVVFFFPESIFHTFLYIVIFVYFTHIYIYIWAY